MPTRLNEFKAYFTITGDFDPSEMTERIGLSPSESWKKGDRNEVSHMERKFSRWSVYSRLDLSRPVVEHMRDVLQQIEPYSAKLKPEISRFEAGMQTVAYFHQESPWFHFDADVVTGCASLGLSIDCDFYTLYSDRREDS